MSYNQTEFSFQRFFLRWFITCILLWVLFVFAVFNGFRIEGPEAKGIIIAGLLLPCLLGLLVSTLTNWYRFFAIGIQQKLILLTIISTWAAGIILAWFVLSQCQELACTGLVIYGFPFLFLIAFLITFFAGKDIYVSNPHIFAWLKQIPLPFIILLALFLGYIAFTELL